MNFVAKNISASSNKLLGLKLSNPYFLVGWLVGWFLVHPLSDLAPLINSTTLINSILVFSICAKLKAFYVTNKYVIQ